MEEYMPCKHWYGNGYVNVKINFRPKKYSRDKEEHYVMIKEKITPQRYNNHKCVEPKIRASKCITKKLAGLKGLINKPVILDGDFNTLSLSNNT